jgi:hypothetical protein
MAVIDLVGLSQLLNSSFLYGLVGGFSIAWFLLKNRIKMKEESTALSPEYYDTCDKVGCIAAINCVLRLTCIVCGKYIYYKVPCFSLPEMIVSSWFSSFEQT